MEYLYRSQASSVFASLNPTTGLVCMTASDIGRQRLNVLTHLCIDTCKQMRDPTLSAALAYCRQLRCSVLIEIRKCLVDLCHDLISVNLALPC